MVELWTLQGEQERGRHNADNLVGLAIDIDGFARHIAATAETTVPEGVAENGYGSSLLALRLSEGAAELRMDSEGFKQ